MRPRPVRTVTARAAQLCCAALAVCAAPALAQAQAAPAAQKLSIELNRAEDTKTGCRLTFVARNDLGEAVEKLGYEVVVFDGEGIVQTPNVILDFGAIGTGKTKVVSFELAAKGACAGVSRLLIDHPADCVAGEAAPDVCTAQLAASTRAKIVFD